MRNRPESIKGKTPAQITELIEEDKKVALEVCAYMWELLAEQPSMDKPKAIRFLNLPGDMVFGCAACTYDRHNKGDDLACSDCPMWPSSEYGGEQYACEMDTSPYSHWGNTSSRDPEDYRDRSEFAQRVADLAQHKLDELEAENAVHGPNSK